MLAIWWQKSPLQRLALVDRCQGPITEVATPMTSASDLITRVAALIIGSSGPITRDFDLTIGAVVRSSKPWLFDHRTSNTSDSNDWAIDFSGLFEKFYLSY